MSAWDTAVALDRIRKGLSSSAAKLDRDKKHSGEHFQKGVVELHNLLGIPETTISQYSPVGFSELQTDYFCEIKHTKLDF